MSRIGSEPGSKTITVNAARLKDYLTQRVDFLKIDIEGAEYQVMKDIQDRLHLVDHLFLEYHGTFEQNAELNELFDMVTRAGFTYYIRQAIEKHAYPFILQKTIDLLFSGLTSLMR